MTRCYDKIMQDTIRTTVRLRKDLIDYSRLQAFNRGISLQEVINETLALGIGHISDLDTRKKAMACIDRFRNSLKGKKIDVSKILQKSKKDLK